MIATERLYGPSRRGEAPMRKLWLSVAAVFLLAGSTVGFAQKPKKGESPTRSLQGVVTSPTNEPAAGAVVQLKDMKTLQIRSFITQPEGTYYFHGLSPDRDYQVRAEFQGMSSDTKTLSAFDSKIQAVINLKLNPKK
jgi:hypothetical protein